MALLERWETICIIIGMLSGVISISIFLCWLRKTRLSGPILKRPTKRLSDKDSMSPPRELVINIQSDDPVISQTNQELPLEEALKKFDYREEDSSTVITEKMHNVSLSSTSHLNLMVQTGDEITDHSENDAESKYVPHFSHRVSVFEKQTQSRPGMSEACKDLETPKEHHSPTSVIQSSLGIEEDAVYLARWKQRISDPNWQLQHLVASARKLHEGATLHTKSDDHRSTKAKQDTNKQKYVASSQDCTGLGISPLCFCAYPA